MSKLIDIARKEIGVTEVKGGSHNAQILRYSKEAGFSYTDDETAWCSIFANWVAMKANLPQSKSARASSWLKVGEVVTNPKAGDIIVFGKGGDANQIYHVGFFTEFSADRKYVYCLGGNQSDSVKISKFSVKEVAGYRRIEPTSIFDKTRFLLLFAGIVGVAYLIFANRNKIKESLPKLE